MTDKEFLSVVEKSVDRRVAGDFLASAQCAAAACLARPDEPSAWHTAAMIASDLGRHEEALYCRKRAVGLLDVLASYTEIPDEQRQYVQQCVFGYATSLLLAGEWKYAWPYWEIGRLGYSWIPPQGTVYWQGQEEGDLLVVCEGGYGDLFCFARFLPMLRAKYPGRRIGLFVFKGLKSFFRDWRELGVDVVYEVGDLLPLPLVWKYATSLLSLPAMLGVMRLADVPQDSLKHTVKPLGGIGFCWRSEENQTKRKFRSLPWKDAEAITGSLAEYAPILSLCPQGRELNGKPLSAHQTSANLVCDDSRMQTWSDTARYLCDMTIVVTVDTAVAHLAGLLNVPTLLLLPLNVDWKWALSGDRTPWYPSIRLFRNRHPLEWEKAWIVTEALALYREVTA